MTGRRIVGLVLVIVGLVALLWGGVSWTREETVADIGPLEVSGFFAWLLWLFVHLMYLVQFSNRLLVLFQWAWSYVTYRRSARLITGTDGGGATS